MGLSAVPNCDVELAVLRAARAARQAAEAAMQRAQRTWEATRAHEFAANQAYIRCLGGTAA
jgi:hypothetical protein